MAKVIFIKSPSCEPFNLAHHIGDEVELSNEVAVKLIEAKFAIPATGKKVETATVKSTAKETRKKAAPKKAATKN